jgi:hypothetical protein
MASCNCRHRVIFIRRIFQRSLRPTREPTSHLGHHQAVLVRISICLTVVPRLQSNCYPKQHLPRCSRKIRRYLSVRRSALIIISGSLLGLSSSPPTCHERWTPCGCMGEYELPESPSVEANIPLEHPALCYQLRLVPCCLRLTKSDCRHFQEKNAPNGFNPARPASYSHVAFGVFMIAQQIITKPCCALIGACASRQLVQPRRSSWVPLVLHTLCRSLCGVMLSTLSAIVFWHHTPITATISFLLLWP